MKVTVELPEDIARRLAAAFDDPPRRALAVIIGQLRPASSDSSGAHTGGVRAPA